MIQIIKLTALFLAMMVSLGTSLVASFLQGRVDSIHDANTMTLAAGACLINAVCCFWFMVKQND